MVETSNTNQAEKQAQSFLKQHIHILELIASGRTTESVYNEIGIMYESRHPGLRCSMLELKDGVLMHGGAPSLPKAYCDAVNGLRYGPSVGSCGTSTYTGKRVLVESIATDPKWAKLKDVALPYGMRCCWSEPIIGSDGTVLGAFGMYYNHEALPNEQELEDLASAAKLAGIVMERDHKAIALRQSEHNYRRLVENLPQRFFLKDKDSVFISCSKNFADDLGISVQQINGTTDFDYFNAADAERYRRDDARIMRTGKAEEIEEPHVSNGKEMTVLTVKAPALNENGDVDGVLGFFSDITEQKTLEAKYNRAQKMESLGLLAGGVAHDLNNVLSSIVGYPELILQELPGNSALKEPLEKIMKSGIQAAEIVSDLLTIARGSVVAKEPLLLNPIIRDYLNSSAFEALHRNHSSVFMKTNLNDDLLHVLGSRTHIEKVIMNLVSNACEAIAENGCVTISTANRFVEGSRSGDDEVKQGKYVVLSVSDDGAGMSAKDLLHIFEPFYSKKVLGRSGTGLGLTIVRNIIDDHNGYIDVTNNGSGLKFELYFPVTSAATKSAKSVSRSSYKGNGECILVIDDLAIQRDVASAMLTHLGYVVKVAASGEDAVEYLKEHRVDLVLLDMLMEPGMDGYETYKKILTVRPGQKAIIVSGYAETENVKKTQSLGAKQYVKKPYSMETIGSAIRDELK